MASKKIHQQPSWQPDRSPNQKENPHINPKISARERPLEVAKIAPGAMMDNVMQATTNANLPATPPREFLQPKLTIGEPRDKYEQEADRMAKEVVQRIRTPISASAPEINPLQRKTQIPFNASRDILTPTEVDEATLQSKTEAYRQVWGDVLQARGRELEGGMVNNDFEGELNRARSGGQSLEPKLQNQMGKAFGTDFSGVKIHTDTQSNKLNQSIQAKAFTTGKDIFFKSGEYQPGSQSGQELIAHELTHVVQQNGDAIQKKEGRDTETNESLADSIQRQSESLIQRFWVDTDQYIKFDEQNGKIRNGASIFDWQSKADMPNTTWQNQNIEITFVSCFSHSDQEYFFYTSQNKFYGAKVEDVTFAGKTLDEIKQAREAWNNLGLPTVSDSILPQNELKDLKTKFLNLGGDRQQFTENVIAEKEGDELKYRLKGYNATNSLELDTINDYAAQKMREARRNLEWGTLNIPIATKVNYLQLSDEHAQRFQTLLIEARNDTKNTRSQQQVKAATDALTNGQQIEQIEKAVIQARRDFEWEEMMDVRNDIPNNAKTNYLEFSDDDARQFRLAIQWNPGNQIIDASDTIVGVILNALNTSTTFEPIKNAIDAHKKEQNRQRRLGEWSDLGIDSELAKTNYLELSDKQAKNFRVAIYDAKVGSGAQRDAAITALATNANLQDIQSAISKKAREEEWPTLGINNLFDSTEIPNTAKEKYLLLDDQNAQKFRLVLSNLSFDRDKKEAVTDFANSTKELDVLLTEARATGESERKAEKWNDFDFQLDENELTDELQLNQAKQYYSQLSPDKAYELEIILTEMKKQNKENDVLVKLALVASENEYQENVLNVFAPQAKQAMITRIEQTYKFTMEETGSQWTLTELEDLGIALERFQHVLGDDRETKNLTVQKLARVIRDKKDGSTMGVTENGGAKITIYDESLKGKDFVKVKDSSTVDEKRQSFRGTATHELTHALIADEKIRSDTTYHKDYAAHLDFWETPKKPKFGGAKDETRRKNGKAGGVEVPITDYGAEDAEEDLCEAVMFYFEDRATLRKQCPIRDAWIHANVIPYLAAPETN